MWHRAISLSIPHPQAQEQSRGLRGCTLAIYRGRELVEEVDPVVDNGGLPKGHLTPHQK